MFHVSFRGTVLRVVYKLSPSSVMICNLNGIDNTSLWPDTDNSSTDSNNLHNSKTENKRYAGFYNRNLVK